MSPSEKVRVLLDERGIEHTDNDEEHVKETCWPYMGELMAVFVEYDNGTTRFACDTWCFTPEQAIAATVGADYGITFAPTFDRPPETMVGETVYDAEGKAIGWIANATAGVGTCELVIEKQPRHGPWIYHFGCGYDFWQPTDCPMPILKHCPNCGARIKEVAE